MRGRYVVAVATCLLFAGFSRGMAQPARAAWQGTHFEIVHNEEYYDGPDFQSRNLHVLIDGSEFSDTSVIELARLLESEYPTPDDLTIHIYTNPAQYPRGLFSYWHTSTDGSPHFYDYPSALVMREDDRFLFRILHTPATRTPVTYVFDRDWRQRPDDESAVH